MLCVSVCCVCLLMDVCVGCCVCVCVVCVLCVCCASVVCVVCLRGVCTVNVCGKVLYVFVWSVHGVCVDMCVVLMRVHGGVVFR